MPNLFVLGPFFLLLILNLPFKPLRKGFAFWSVGLLLLVQMFNALRLWFMPGSSVDRLGSFFAFSLAIDKLSLIMLFTIAIVAFVSLLIAKSTIAQERQKFPFFNLLLISIIGMNATVLSRDIFSLYVFMEITAVAVFVLMAIEKDKFTIEGTFKYLVLSMLASIFILSGTALLILTAGGTSFSEVRSAFSSGHNAVILNLASGLFLCGLFIKSGAVPFHGWVPDAYAHTQSAVSVLLAGIVTKVSGIYVLLRLFSSVFVLKAPFQNVLMSVGVISIVFAALATFTQSGFKRLLSYSSISQVGYILLALGCATPLAFAGAVFHFFNHAIFKSLLFVNAASLKKELDSTEIPIIMGLGYRLPVTRATSLVGFLSTSGIPPFSGFWSKLIIIIALLASGRALYAAVALLASVLTLAYFLYFTRNVFFIKTEAGPGVHAASVPLGIKLCEVMLAAITLAAGIGFPFMLNTWILPLRGIFN